MLHDLADRRDARRHARAPAARRAPPRCRRPSAARRGAARARAPARRSSSLHLVGRRHERKYAAAPARGRLAAVAPLADRLAQRTLELVDIPSESLARGGDPRAAARARAGAARARCSRATRPFSGRPSAAQRRRWSSSPVTTTPFPPRATCPAGSRTAPCTGCGASDMKGGVAVALELVRELATVRPGPSGRRAAALRPRGASAAAQPAAGALRRGAARARGRPRDPARADRPHDPGRLRRQPVGAGDVPRRQRPLRAARGSPTTRSTARSRASRPSPRTSDAKRSSTGCRSTRCSR